MKSPPLSASRVALVAAATISSTLWDSARRRNFVRVWSAAAIADGVRLRPSSPPAPRRTISFSLSMTSNDRSGRTWTTIMCTELVPMSIAAMRIEAGAQQGPTLARYTADIYLRTHKSPTPTRGQNGRDPTMSTRAPRPTTRLLQRLAGALGRHLPAAIAGENTGVHQARVASRRLREAVPVLSTGLKGSKAGKATRKIRRLTRALGTVRELDVTLGLLDELALRPDVPRTAVEDVRACVVPEREVRRAVMLKRLDHVDAEKISRR